MNNNGYDWNDAAIQRLRDLWAEGHSTAEIGRRMHVSKNSIVGKAHRLDLPKRLDPVRKLSSEGPRRNVPPVRLRKDTLPPLPEPVVFIPSPKPHIEAPKPVQPDPAPAEAAIEDAHVMLFAPVSAKAGQRGCLFPIGPRRPMGGFRECGDVRAISGRTGGTMPYCDAHAGVCYTTYRSAAA
jgi:GcrA cell cycle regulator